MKKIHNMLLASILCIGATQVTMADTDEVLNTDASTTTIEQLASEIGAMSIEDRKALRNLLHVNFSDNDGDAKGERGEKGDWDAKKGEHSERFASEEGCDRDKGGKEDHRQSHQMEREGFKNWILSIMDKYHSEQDQ